MNILIVSSEIAPFAYSGGLGDVIGSLSKEIAAISTENDIRCVMPLYSVIDNKYREGMNFVGYFYVNLAWRNIYCGVFAYRIGKVSYYFLDNEYYFKRNMIYGDFDDGERFAFFSKSSLEFTRLIGWTPDIIHANDWQSALSIVYQKCYNTVPYAKTVYTVHNIEYQGKYSFGLLGDIFSLPDKYSAAMRFNGDINLTKGAICLCDKLTTVSKRYQEELMCDYYAHSLDGIIRENSYKMHGIVNGIDVEKYTPKADKATAKKSLQECLKLRKSEKVPIISMVTRLVTHKGIDLVLRVIEDILKADVQFILLGRGDGRYEDFFCELSGKYQDKVYVKIGFDGELSNKIYSGSDFFLMPSKTEPCGTAQMIACVNGTIPIVRETGGLFDTVKPYNKQTGEGNGITFATYNAHDMLNAIWRALGIFADKKSFEKLKTNAKGSDFSWKKSAKEYLELYKGLYNE